MIPAHRAGLAMLCLLAWVQPVRPAQPERSVSISRQFLVYGDDIRLRGAVCDLAERTKQDVLQLVHQRDEWIVPVVVNVQHSRANLPEAPRAALNLAQTGFGLKLQLDLTMDAETSQSEVRSELLRAILLEMMYRRTADLPAGTTYVPPPDWLVDGILPRQSDLEWEKLISLLRSRSAARRIPLREFLRSRRSPGFDTPSRSLYRAYSFALVELLLDAPAGRAKLAGFIADLSFASNDEFTDLGAHFPELSSATIAEKAWNARITQLATGPLFRLLGAQETEQKLDKLLVREIFDAGFGRKPPLDELRQFTRKASSKFALARCSRELNVFATRANPIYRPLICEYGNIATLLACGKTKGINQRLARLRVSRKEIAARARKIADYMNWFEATKSRELSGAFTDYLKAAELATQPKQKRRDSMSVYLDVLETQFQN